MALLTKNPAARSQPVELPEAYILLTVLGCALAVFVTITLLVHWQLTSHVDREGWTWWPLPGVLGSRRPRASPRLGDAVPLLTILVMAGVLAPVRWGGGWRLLLLPWASAAVAFLSASVIKDAMARATTRVGLGQPGAWLRVPVRPRDDCHGGLSRPRPPRVRADPDGSTPPPCPRWGHRHRLAGRRIARRSGRALADGCHRGLGPRHSGRRRDAGRDSQHTDCVPSLGSGSGAPPR